jgi:hypothetical protein
MLTIRIKTCSMTAKYPMYTRGELIGEGLREHFLTSEKRDDKSCIRVHSKEERHTEL